MSVLLTHAKTHRQDATPRKAFNMSSTSSSAFNVVLEKNMMWLQKWMLRVLSQYHCITAASVPKHHLELVRHFNVHLWIALHWVVKCFAVTETYPKADLSISLKCVSHFLLTCCQRQVHPGAYTLIQSFAHWKGGKERYVFKLMLFKDILASKCTHGAQTCNSTLMLSASFCVNIISY